MRTSEKGTTFRKAIELFNEQISSERNLACKLLVGGVLLGHAETMQVGCAAYNVVSLPVPYLKENRGLLKCDGEASPSIGWPHSHPRVLSSIARYCRTVEDV